ncbi:hypothetical protein CKM354_001294200 [Cercospora kikuchii]|uniref:FAD-binding domain-containing protein n=1 Tax=Cercospora kikuchii TaxID=84275 RepID=A0A9P3FMY6_9PEZI|nr:uncharacterized protein CKM354_001294200 [Cercospora kikuchii]GIZ49925.1 hypothetical protein CKM354_001294200 [Cercospora kikuchii]
MSGTAEFHVAIVGGGIGGICLGLALQHRRIPFTIYESRAEFHQIGAGIVMAAHAVRALQLCDPSLCEKFGSLDQRNDTIPTIPCILNELRYGVSRNGYKDGEVIHQSVRSRAGGRTVHRHELLSILAKELKEGCAQFNKRLKSYDQRNGRVRLKFADGTEAFANILVAMDGIHSSVRTCMFGAESHLSKAVYSHSLAYRAVIPMDRYVEAFGGPVKYSTLSLGPGTTLIHYPVSGGTQVNCGAFVDKRGSGEIWPHAEWIIPDQREQFRRDFHDFGPGVQKILDMMESMNPSVWALHQYSFQPESFVDGLVILAGDAAHSMLPHLGAGASQAIEDAYVLAETLASPALTCSPVSAGTLHAALVATEQARIPRFSAVQRLSENNGHKFYDFVEQKLDDQALQDWLDEYGRRFDWLWDYDVALDAVKARKLLQELLERAESVSKN